MSLRITSRIKSIISAQTQSRVLWCLALRARGGGSGADRQGSARRSTMRTILATGTSLLAVVLAHEAVAAATPFVYITNQEGSVSQFDGGSSGLLSPLTPATVAGGTTPLGIAVSANGTSLYVANSTFEEGISQYTVTADGQLMPKAPATIDVSPEGEAVATYLAVSPNGRDVYASSGPTGTGFGLIFQYTVQSDGTLVAKTPENVFSGETQGIVVSPSSKSVYTTRDSHEVVQWAASPSDGTLTEVSSTMTGPGAGRVAISPSGNALYVTDFSGEISQYMIGPGGELTPMTPATVPTVGLPIGLAVSPSGKNLYVANAEHETASQYAIAADGLLSAMIPATVNAGTDPTEVAVSADGESVYVTNLGSENVSQFSVGANGALSPKTPATIPTGSSPRGIAVTPMPQVAEEEAPKGGGPTGPTGDGSTGTGGGGSGTTATTAQVTSRGAELPQPVVGQRQTVSPGGGTVTIRLAGTSRFVALQTATSIPNGSEVDATNGRVTITVATHTGTESAEAYGGRFVLHQDHTGSDETHFVLSLALTGCPRMRLPRGAAAAVATAAKHSSGPKSRHLWVSESGGSWGTNGRYVSTTVEGTHWLTLDECNRSEVTVAAGKVKVHDLANNKTKVLTAGKSYTAAAKRHG